MELLICNANPGKINNEYDTQIVVSNSLQMGWDKSSPFFCVALEMA
jgi:hypothetical protein